jgi:hypothetical protein
MRRSSCIKDNNGNYLYDGDSVIYIVMRCSANYSSWGQIRSIDDGYYKINGTIIFKDGAFKIIGNKEEIEQLTWPRGKEQFNRNVWYEEFDLGEYKRYYLGKEFGKGYIEKIIKYKKKVITNERLHLLGIQ